MYQLYQEVHYEDDKIAYKGYVSSLHNEELTITFNPFNIVCQEGVVYRGTGVESCKVYDTNLFSTIQKVCTEQERSVIDSYRKLYKVHILVCRAIHCLYPIALKFEDIPTIQQKMLTAIKSEEYYLVSTDSANGTLTAILKHLKAHRYSTGKLARLSGLPHKEIKELLQDG